MTDIRRRKPASRKKQAKPLELECIYQSDLAREVSALILLLTRRQLEDEDNELASNGLTPEA